MADHQSNKDGNILFVFCGGGCKAVIQAVAAAELVHAGLLSHPHHEFLRRHLQCSRVCRESRCCRGRENSPHLGRLYHLPGSDL